MEKYQKWVSQKLEHNNHCQNHEGPEDYAHVSAISEQDTNFDQCTSLHLAKGCPVPETFRRQGVEHQPGPRWHAKDISDLFVIDSTNVTALSTCPALIADRGTHLQFLQEHSVPKHGLQAWIRTFAACKFLLDAGPLDPELNRAGGVAVLAANPYSVVP